VVVDKPVAKKPKLSTYTLHHQRLVMKMKTEFKYRKVFHDLKERQKKERIDDIVINIIAACIDSIAMKKNDQYYVGDEDFANSVANMLNRVHNELEKRIKTAISETPVPLLYIY
jgi:methionine synthase II (cobalamin-independent)